MSHFLSSPRYFLHCVTAFNRAYLFTSGAIKVRLLNEEARELEWARVGVFPDEFIFCQIARFEFSVSRLSFSLKRDRAKIQGGKKIAQQENHLLRNRGPGARRNAAIFCITATNPPTKKSE